MGRCFLWNDIPLIIDKNNLFYWAIFDVVVVGQGYKVPTYDELRKPILQKEKANIITKLEDLKKCGRHNNV